MFNVVVSHGCKYHTYLLENNLRYRQRGKYPQFIVETLDFGGLDIYDFNVIDEAENFASEVEMLHISSKDLLLEIAKKYNMIGDKRQTTVEMFASYKPKNSKVPSKVTAKIKKEVSPETIDLPFQSIDNNVIEKDICDKSMVVLVKSINQDKNKENFDETIHLIESMRNSKFNDPITAIDEIKLIQKQMVSQQMVWMKHFLLRFKESEDMAFFDAAASIRSSISDKVLNQAGFKLSNTSISGE